MAGFSNLKKEKPAFFCLSILFLLVVSLVIYANSLHGEFLIDDQPGILNNQSIHDVKTYFSKYFNLRSGVLWDVALTFLWHFFGSNTFYYHLFNVLLHAGCVILLFLLCNALFKNSLLSFLSALIFAIHPIHTEAVSWISGGVYPFPSLFFLASFLFYVKSDRSVYYLALSLIFFILCFFAGHAVMALPVMFLAYDIFFREKTPSNKSRLKFRVLILFLISAVAIVQLLITFVDRKQIMHLIYQYKGLNQLAVNFKALLYYLKILYLPLARGLYHPFAFSGTDTRKVDFMFFLAAFVVLAAIILFFRLRRRFAPVSFGIMWFLITYAPFSNIIPICNIVSERYLYLPSAGFSVVMAALFLKVMDVIHKHKYKITLRYAAIAALTLYLGAYATLTVRRNYEYDNIFYYWESNIRNFEKGYIVYNNLAALFYMQGRVDVAMSYCWVNLMVNPEQPHVWCNLGMLYYQTKDLKTARECYEEALRYQKDYPPALEALEEIKKQEAKKPKKKK